MVVKKSKNNYRSDFDTLPIEDQKPKKRADLERVTALGERLASLILTQLKRGPKASDDDRPRIAFNGFLRDMQQTSGVSFSKEDWQTFIRETLKSSVRFTPVFDDGGARLSKAIVKDAAYILDIDKKVFSKWGKHYEIDSVDTQLKGKDVPSFDRTKEGKIKRRLFREIASKVAEIAEEVLDISDAEASFGKADETLLQWEVAQICNTKDTGKKVNGIARYVEVLFVNADNDMAGRTLALVVKNSRVNQTPSRVAGIIPRWKKAEVRLLIKELMHDPVWGVANSRAFRRYFPRKENHLINQMVSKANGENAIQAIADLDVTKVAFEDFMKVVEESGVEDVIVERAWRKMVSTANSTEFEKYLEKK